MPTKGAQCRQQWRVQYEPDNSMWGKGIYPTHVDLTNALADYYGEMWVNLFGCLMKGQTVATDGKTRSDTTHFLVAYLAALWSNVLELNFIGRPASQPAGLPASDAVPFVWESLCINVSANWGEITLLFSPRMVVSSVSTDKLHARVRGECLNKLLTKQHRQ